MNPTVEDEEFATLGITYPYPIHIHKPRRSDFVLFKGDNWECTQYKYFANTPIKDSNGNLIPCQRGRDGCLYPSDHLGILTQFTRIP